MTRTSLAPESGFTLVEVLVAMALVATGALALGGALGVGARLSLGSQGQLLASARAAEAIETVFKARDNRILTWAQIRNVKGASGNDGGVFLDGPQTIRDPGADGLVNTADDGAPVVVDLPGKDGILGTADDILRPLTGYTREIQIRDVETNLRSVTVTITYPSMTGTKTYVLTTYVSTYA